MSTTTPTRYYYIRVFDGVEPGASKPFQSETDRDDAARREYAKLDRHDYLWWAEVTAEGELTINSYDHDFFDSNNE